MTNHFKQHIILGIKDRDIQGKLEYITNGLTPEHYNSLAFKVLPYNKQNVITICDYITSTIHETNPGDHHRSWMISMLINISMFFNNEKKFNEITREDLLSYLQGFKKNESVDPKHKWITTYNAYLVHSGRFFKWLYYPDMNSKERPLPPLFKNITKLKRREISSYTPDDIWTPEEILLFLRSCPSPRNACYHAMAWDTSNRPHELLKLRNKDIKFIKSPEGKLYAVVTVNGKTGIKSNPLIDSIPYVKEWMKQHPQSGNRDSIFLCGLDKSLGMVINTSSLTRIYSKYKTRVFPKLLNSPNTSEDDKEALRNLLSKPWNPYIVRHSALTYKARMLKESALRQHAGWTKTSDMVDKYIHFFNTESSNEILQAAGILPKDKEINPLKSKYCPNCKEPNKPDAKFCAKCRMVLQYDSYLEALESEKKKDLRIQNLEDQLKSLEESQKQSFKEFKQENRHIIAEAMAKYTAQLSPKALERFRKRIGKILEEG